MVSVCGFYTGESFERLPSGAVIIYQHLGQVLFVTQRLEHLSVDAVPDNQVDIQAVILLARTVNPAFCLIEITHGFIQPEIIAGDACTIIPDLGLYEFGILTSNVHMAWVRVVCGRIKSDFRYQASVYNNFPWPQPAEKEKQRIAETAQGILDARSLYSNSCLADLYDPTFMPPELRKAHMDNDRAVMQAYGMPIKETDEAACVAWLMKLYQEKLNEPK